MKNETSFVFRKDHQMKNNGDIVRFFRDKEYVMLDNDLGGGSFGKTVLLKDPFIDDVFVAKNMSLILIAKMRGNDFTKISLRKSKSCISSIIII